MKYFIYKLAFIPALLLLILIMPGCKKFLDTDRQGGYNPENYPYPSGSGPYDQFIFGAYNELRAFNLHSQAFIATTSIRSDDADKGSTASDGGANAIDMDNFPVSPSNGYCNTIWLGAYSLINKANVAIKEIETNKIIVADEAVKNQTLAEAKGLRAYGYFLLVRLFGRVPLIDKVNDDNVSGNNIPQSSPEQTYAFIEQDLQFAAAKLPLSWDSKIFPGRLTSGAANGLLAKVYLQQKKWPQAMATAQMVMSSGVYNLSTSYDMVFREQGENCPESLFEVQATASNVVPSANGVQYAQIQGIRGSGAWDQGWGWNTPSALLEAFYEPNDPRKDRTILKLSTAAVSRTSIYGEILPIYNPGGTPPNPQYNGKVQTDPARRNSVGNRFGYWMNVRLLRYPDVLLMFAEAATEVGGAENITAARNAVNLVRERARRGAPVGTLPNITTTDQAELREAVRKERRAEMAMEHDRFFDLVRWGIAQDVLNAAGKTNFTNNRDVLLPIPQTQIDLSAGVLKQNTGY